MKDRQSHIFQKTIIALALLMGALGYSQAPQPPQTSSSNKTNGCGSTITLGVYSPNAPVGLTHEWYTSLTGSQKAFHTVVNTGGTSTYVTEIEVSQSISYWVAAKYNGQESSRTEVTATYTTPNTSSPNLVLGWNQQPPCGPTATFNLGAGGGGSGSTYDWYETSNTSGSYIHRGTSFNPTLTYSGNGQKTYWVKASMTSDNCYSGPNVNQTKSITVSFQNPVPTPSANNTFICGPGSVTLSASGSPGSYRWYAPNGSIISGASSNSYTISNLTATATYQVSSYVNGCESPKRSVTATVRSIPTAPSTTGNFTCGPGSVTLSASGSSGSYRWYAPNGSLISGATSSSYTISNLTATATYQVSSYVNGCESARRNVTATLRTLPTAPSANGDSTCGPGSVVLTASGSSGSYRWYAPNGSRISGATSSNFTILNLTSSATYQVSSYVNGCESPKTNVTATVQSVPAAPAASDRSRCGPGQLTLSASGSSGSYRWYAPNGSLISGATSSSYTISNLTATATYQVSSYVNGCEGPKTSVGATLDVPPALPTINGGFNTCGNNSVELSATSPNGNGISHIWYTTATGTNTITPEVNEIGSYVTSITVTLAGSDISYWVSAVQNNCESERRQVTATYQNNGTVPSLSLQDVSTNTDRCGSGSFILAANITNGGTGHTLDWYEAASGGTAIGSGPSLSINLDQSDMENDGTKTFWVGGTLYNSGGCAYPIQNRESITVSLDPLPPTPTGNSVDRCGPGTIELTASGNGTLRWYTLATGGTHLAEGSSYSPNIDQDTTFYVEAISPTTGCASERHPILAQVAQTSTWYLDFDGDGHAVSSQENCGSPGTGWTDTVLPIDDCNDAAYSLENICSGPPEPGTCNNGNVVPNDPTDQNYIYTRNYQTERSSIPGAKFLEDNGYVQDIAYFDGLGRPIQNIAIRQSPDSLDIVQHIGYDSYGRKDKEWLPVPLPDTQGALGSYRTLDMAQATREYYKAAYEDDFIGIDVSQINPYSQQGFERSPLNRVEKQAAPGETWKLGNGHEVEMAYEANEAQEVRKFGVSLNFTNKTYYPTLLDLGVYDEGELSKTVVRDENHNGTTQNHTVEEFKDKQGRVLLKRTYADIDLNADGDTLDTGEQAVAHDTYYVYDDYGNLSYVLPPLMEPHTADLATLLAAMEDVGYQYVYDHRNRVVQKWVPGKKDWDYMVYNNLDQPVMTQDANLRANNEWLFTKYDVHGRVAYTGIAINAETREQAQTYVSGLTGVLWVTRTDQAITVGGATLYYTNDGYPKNTISEVQTISYYDSYDNLNLPAGVPSSITILGSSPAETQSDQVHGLPTLSQVKVLEVDGPNNWIHALTYYDDKGRAVYAYSQNAYLGTVDIVENQLDFTGKPTKVRTAHTRNGATIVTIDNFTYDHTGRLLAQTQCVGDGTLGDFCPGASDNGIPPVLNLTGQTISTPQTATQRIFTTDGVLQAGTQLTLVPGGTTIGDQELIVLNEYDALGLLKTKKVGGEAAATVTNSAGLQQTLHSYNVRGWLTQLNDPTNLGDQLFAFGLKYHDPDVTGKELYNGNISQTFWKTASVQTGTNDISERYTYTYDALNRITKAEDNTGHYDLDLVRYDKNGNIEKLQRQGHTNVAATAFGLMDDLSYAYNGNQLERVSDLDGTTTGFVDGNPGGGTDYTYDQNGNMLSDANKGITAIEYNHLDLPTKVTINGNGNVGNIVYIYDATGTKLRKIATDTGESSVTHTDYAGNYIYEGNATATTLQFFSHPEGYVKVDNGQYGYVYQYTDHLGNVRLSYTQGPADGSLEIVEENNYYPFGLKHRGYNTFTSALGNDAAQRWKFGGKEYQEDMDLAWYDVSARNYDLALGRWMNLDPLAEQMRRHSPYNYAFDNPIYFLDADGMAPQGSQGGQANDSGGTQYRVEDEYGNIAIMSSSELAAYITANGVTDGFSGNGGEDCCKDGKCKCRGSQKRAAQRKRDKERRRYQQLFRKNAEEIQAWLDAVNYEPRKYGGDGSGSFMDNVHKVRDFLDKFNPIAYLFDSVYYAVDGTDRYGNKMSLGEASFNALGAVPLFRLGTATVSLRGTTSLARSSISYESISLITSSGSLAPSRTYTIYEASGAVYKFGVTDSNLIRYYQSLKEAGPGAYGKFSGIMYKGKAHTMERYMRSLYYNSTGIYTLPGMKYPYPINFNTNKIIKP